MSHCFAWDNLVLGATLSADSYAAGMPPQNLQDDTGSPSVAWQTAAGVTSSDLTITLAGPSPVAAVGIFRTNLTSSASVTVSWILGGNVVSHITMQSLVSGYGQMAKALTAPVTSDTILISINDATNPDGFLNVPLCFVGPAWFPLSGASYSSADGNDDDVAELRTRGGQEYVTLHWQGRRRTIVLDGVRDSEMWADLQPMLRTARRGGNALYIPDTASSELNEQAIFGRLKQTADVGYLSNQFDRRTVTLSLTERL